MLSEWLLALDGLKWLMGVFLSVGLGHKYGWGCLFRWMSFCLLDGFLLGCHMNGMVI